MDTEKKGFPGEPIGKGDYNISAFCPALRHSFSKEKGCQGQVVAGFQGDQRQKWRCLEWCYKKS